MTFRLPIAGCLLGLAGSALRAQEASPPAGPDGVAAVKAGPEEAMENSYAADRAAVLRQVLARYVDELAALEKSLAAAGDSSGAARVRLEHDRVLPALGLPAVAAEDADEFAAFEAPAALPEPPVPAVLPKDLDAILQSLAPAGPDKPAASTLPAAVSGTPGAVPAGKGSKKLLRMGTAALNGTYDPVYPWQYWSMGRTASWTLSGLPAGSYQVVLRYACDNKTGGGKLAIRLGDTSRDVEIAPTGSWKRRRELVAGSFVIKDARADLVLQPSSINSGMSYLMDLVAVMILPEGDGCQAMKAPDRPLIFITGGGGALAQAIASAFHAAHWQIAAPPRRALDVRDGAAVQHYVDQLPRVDLLVINAAVRRDAPFLKLPESAWDDVLDTNLRGAWLCARAVLPRMRAQGGGHVVAMGSHTARHGVAGQTAYGASKAALMALTQSLAAESGPDNIRVNAVLPGWIPTPFHAGVPEEGHQTVRRQHHLGRFNTLEHTAAFLLALHGLAHTSGQVFQLDSRPGSWL